MIEEIKKSISDREIKYIICDIDGTLAKRGGRGPYDRDRVGEDECIDQVRKCIYGFEKQGFEIVIFSGRDDKCIIQTVAWLSKYCIKFHSIHMRVHGDGRTDEVVKKEMLERIGKENVFAVIDDRPRVIRMRREEGLFVFDVGNGIEF